MSTFRIKYLPSSYGDDGYYQLEVERDPPPLKWWEFWKQQPTKVWRPLGRYYHYDIARAAIERLQEQEKKGVIIA